MSDRYVLHVIPQRGVDWAVKVEGGKLLREGFQDRAEAEHFAIRRAKGRHKRGQDAQVKIHTADGRIQEEFTYGHDPERSPG